MRIEVALDQHLTDLRAIGAAPSTTSGRRNLLKSFVAYCEATGVTTIGALTYAVATNYQRHLSDVRNANDITCSIGGQRNRLVALRMFARWAVRTGLLDADPTSALVLPRLPHRLPQSVLTSSEAERVLAVPDVTTRLGLRDRAILELLYSSGIRRLELIAIDIPDLDLARGVLFIRLGKGRKDRYVPVGQRALGWIDRYLSRARPQLVHRTDPAALFIGKRGTRLSRSRITERMHGYLAESGVAKPGSCHVWRHTMATLMHERGADIRDLQVLLGHSQLSTTAIYTHISTERLQEVHRRTPPTARAIHSHTPAPLTTETSVSGRSPHGPEPITQASNSHAGWIEC
ncbi:MAG: tyrosine-type recombinase/integrase [Gemmatimonadaceae bacterium]